MTDAWRPRLTKQHVPPPRQWTPAAAADTTLRWGFPQRASGDAATAHVAVPRVETASRAPLLGARQTRRAVVLVLTAALTLGWVLALRPVGLGGSTTYVVVSGRSMEPTHRTGDLVIARTERKYRVGDVVAFRVPDVGTSEGPVVIHRIVGGDAEGGYELQGDNKDEQDIWRPRPSDILGRAWIKVPRGGFVLAAARSPLALAALTATFVFLAVAASPARRDPSQPTATSRSSAGTADTEPLADPSADVSVLTSVEELEAKTGFPERSVRARLEVLHLKGVATYSYADGEAFDLSRLSRNETFLATVHAAARH